MKFAPFNHVVGCHVETDGKTVSDTDCLRLNVAEINDVETYLANNYPNFSSLYGSGYICASFVLLATLLLSLFIGLGYANYTYIIILIFNIPIVFIRIKSVLTKENNSEIQFDLNYENLPIYSIMIAVYDEKSVINQLVKALNNINWDKDKLDIIFLCEEDDKSTINEIRKHHNKLKFRTIILPKGRLKTKPRALQAGLKYVKGQFLVIYDAEDIPDCNQLLLAYQKFMQGDESLAVLQAPLVPKNHEENFISAQFTIDYASWYRVFIPYYSKKYAVFPLGGTSNHFKVNILKKVGGWDPANLTEDADLGMRLALNGYHAKTISLPTIEEAPPRISLWLKQRTRWIQGHMQTIDIALKNVNMAFKVKKLSEYVNIILALMTGPFYGSLRIPSLLLLSVMSLNYWLIAGALLPEIIIAIMAVKRDKRYKLFMHIILIPLYWFIQTIALYRAIIRTFTKPLVWEKTTHGNAARGNN